MSDPVVPPMISEREAVKRERKAFENGAVCWVGELMLRERSSLSKAGPTVTLAEIRDDAMGKFPLPTIVRPRVVTNNGYSWRVSDGALWRLDTGYNQATWRYVIALGDPGFEKTLADLLANPTEEVDDER